MLQSEQKIFVLETHSFVPSTKCTKIRGVTVQRDCTNLLLEYKYILRSL
jgi:hypothetical protein